MTDTDTTDTETTDTETTGQTKFDRVLAVARKTAIEAVARANLLTDIAPEVVALGYMQAAAALSINARGPEYTVKRLRALIAAIENPAPPVN
jgi:hypothetical protein